MNEDINQAVRLIRAHGTVIYPTETFYALGGMGTSLQVVEKIVKIKGRPDHKPLPLVAGSMEQCLKAVYLDRETIRLAEMFWPGPLSVLARARDMIPLGVKDSQGLVSIRVTPHPLTVSLCLEAGSSLIATSANFSGKEASASYKDLDPRLIKMCDLSLDSSHSPAGRQPSTLVRVTGPQK
ncbi:MAG: L-threonylcarbamoyladenylate synthase, partial [Desulfovibrionales bacterium]|nr:L-threonylcarbamoyladenylate synthase [Desulfovibrionales bacterium]